MSKFGDFTEGWGGDYFSGQATGKEDVDGDAIMKDGFKDKLKSGQAIDDVASSASATVSVLKDVTAGKDDRMDERGNMTHDVNWLSNAATMTVEGAKYGGVWGGAGGFVTSLALSGYDQMQNNDITAVDQSNAENSYLLENSMKTIKSEDSYSKQQAVAEDGLKVSENAPVEVEKDEVVLRKSGKAYKQVADFKGGKSHAEGGEQYAAQDGDIIVPGKYRKRLGRAMNLKKWSAVTSIVQQLPSDTGQDMFEKGVKDFVDKKGRTISRSKNTRGITKGGYDWYKNLDDDLKGFYNEVVDRFPDFVFTSGQRDVITKANGKTVKDTGRHKAGQALDIGVKSSYNKRVFKWLVSTKEGLELMQKYKVGALNEEKAITANWDGSHVHIGKDTNLVAKTNASYTEKTKSKNFAEARVVLNKALLSSLNEYATTTKNQITGSGSQTSQGGIGSGGTIFQDASNQEVTQAIYARFIEEGFTPEGATAATANLYHESAGFTAFEESGDNVNGEKGVGLAQWSGSRRTDFETFMEGDNRDKYSLDDQMDFLVEELQTSYKGTYEAMKTATDTEAASLQWVSDFEKPSESKASYEEQAVSRVKDFTTSTGYDSKTLSTEHEVDGFKTSRWSVATVKADPMVNMAGQTREEWIKENPSTGGLESLKTMEIGKSTEADTPDVFTPNMRKSEYAAVVLDTKVKEVHVAQQKATDFNAGKNKGYFNSNDPKGQQAKATWEASLAIGGAIGGSRTGWPWLDRKVNQVAVGIAARVAETVQDIGEYFDPDFKIFGGDLNASLQTTGIEDSELLKEAENFYKFLQHGDADGNKAPITSYVVGDGLRLWSGALSGVAGQEASSIGLSWISDLISGAEPEELEETLAMAREAGIITEKAEYMVRDIAKNPEYFITNQQQAAQTIDVMTILANPSGAWQAGKFLLKGGLKGVALSGKGLWEGAKWTGKGLVKLTQAKTWAKFGEIIKQTPAMANKMFKSLDNALGGATNWDPASIKAMEDALNGVTSGLKEAKVPLPKGATAKIAKQKTWLKDAKTFFKTMPDKFRKAWTGNTLEQIKAYQKQVQDISGKTADELLKMKPEEVVNLMTGKIKAAQAGFKESMQGQKAIWKEMETSAGSVKEAQKFLDDAIKAGKGPDKIAELEKALSTSKQGLKDLVGKANDLKASGREYEELLGKIAAKDSFIQELAKGKVMPEGINTSFSEYKRMAKEAIEESAALKKTFSDKFGKTVGDDFVVQFEKLTKSYQDLAKTANGQTVATDVAKAAEAAKSYVDTAKLQASMPKLMGIIEKDANLMKLLKEGSAGLPKLLNALRDRGVDAVDVDQLEKTYKDYTDLDIEEVEDEVKKEGDKKGDKKGDTVIPVVEELDEEEVVVTTDKPLNPTINPKEVVEQKSAFAENFQNTVGSLASYAPAVYNIVKGLENPETVTRHFTNPQTRKYANMSQPELTAIDEAFSVAQENARNLSGGSMSNFRANTEKAWAEKMGRVSKVNQKEAARADKIAADNIQTHNRADFVNMQANQKYDMMDMKSKAATESFFAQGMQDVANIGAVHRKDRNAKEAQDKSLEMMGYKDPNAPKTYDIGTSPGSWDKKYKDAGLGGGSGPIDFEEEMAAGFVIDDGAAGDTSDLTDKENDRKFDSSLDEEDEVIYGYGRGR